MKEVEQLNDRSEVVSRMLGLMYPFILIFGFYIIINGHITPGGGFQGGAILSAVFISRYLIDPVHDIRINSLALIEKLSYVFITAIPVLLLLTVLKGSRPFSGSFSAVGSGSLYMMLMNILIGIKVSCGLTIVFFRFVFYESQ